MDAVVEGFDRSRGALVVALPPGSAGRRALLAPEDVPLGSAGEDAMPLGTALVPRAGSGSGTSSAVSSFDGKVGLGAVSQACFGAAPVGSVITVRMMVPLSAAPFAAPAAKGRQAKSKQSKKRGAAGSGSADLSSVALPPPPSGPGTARFAQAGGSLDECMALRRSTLSMGGQIVLARVLPEREAAGGRRGGGGRGASGSGSTGSKGGKGSSSSSSSA